MKLNKEQQKKLFIRLKEKEDIFKKDNPKGYEQRKNLITQIAFPLHTDYFVSTEGKIPYKVNAYGNTEYINILFTAILDVNQWELIEAFKGSKNNFIYFKANDITRMQYLKLAKHYKKFFAQYTTLQKHLPDSVILNTIVNPETISQLKGITPQNLLGVFNKTPHGKRIKYLFDDFGLAIKDISCKWKTFKRENDKMPKESLDIVLTTTTIL